MVSCTQQDAQDYNQMHHDRGFKYIATLNACKLVFSHTAVCLVAAVGRQMVNVVNMVNVGSVSSQGKLLGATANLC